MHNTMYTHVHTATYGVQEAKISEGNLLNSICITCIFAQGTSAQGCYISLLENHDSVATNTTGLRIEREGDSLNATGCIEDLEGGLYHVVVYDVEADGTVDWQNRALVIIVALNLTSTPDQVNISWKEPSHKVDASKFLFFVLGCMCIAWCKKYSIVVWHFQLWIFGFGIQLQ